MTNDVPGAAPDQRLIDRGEALKRIAWVSVLNSDDTFTGLDGCWIAPTTGEEVDALDEGKIDVGDLPHRFPLNDLLMLAIEAGIFDDWLAAHEGCPA